MKLNLSYAMIFGAAICLASLDGCASKTENDDSLESSEPVDAAPQAAASTDTSSSDAAAAPTELAPSAAPASTASQAGASSTGRRVMYVKVSGAALRERPEPKARVLGTLEKGDHMLVTIEGDWARTDDGKFVSVKVLSEKGIGRGKKDAAWSAGRPVSSGNKSQAAKSEIAKKLPKKPVNQDDDSKKASENNSDAVKTESASPVTE